MTKDLQGSSHHLKVVGFRLWQTKGFYLWKKVPAWSSLDGWFWYHIDIKKNRIWCRQLRNVVNFSHATQKPQRWQPLGFSCINENYDRHKKEAVWNTIQLHDLSGNRTRVYAVRGRRLDRLTNRPESRRQDSNLRPLRPERSALPNWATPRLRT